MIINIHGFGGKGENTKYLWLRKAYPDEDIHHRTFDYSATAPGEILSHYAGQAREALGRGEPVRFLGTSWGGFFAYCLNVLFPDCPTVLVNPSLNPHLARKFLDIEADVLRNYAALFGEHMLRHSPETCLAIVGTRDEVIPHAWVTEPIFHEGGVRRFDVAHDFDIEAETEIGRAIMEHFGRRLERSAP